MNEHVKSDIDARIYAQSINFQTAFEKWSAIRGLHNRVSVIEAACRGFRIGSYAADRSEGARVAHDALGIANALLDDASEFGVSGGEIRVANEARKTMLDLLVEKYSDELDRWGRLSNSNS